MNHAGTPGPERIVVVGFGPVAARLVEHLEPLVARGVAAVTVIGEEPHAAYNRVLVADVAVGRTRESAIRLADAAALAVRGIDVRLGARVARVDRPFRRVLLDDGRSVDYDRLVLATGSRPVLPPLAGVDGASLPPGVGFLRDLTDARLLAEAMTAERRIVVLGGGILGIEAALAAAEEGARVTLVHTGRAPMERFLGDGAQVLGAALARTGITVVGGSSTGLTLDDDGRFSGLVLAGGTCVEGGALVIACGVRPRTELADGCDLNTAAGILVDHDLRALDTQDVWAIGDCAEIRCWDAACVACSGVTAPRGLIAPGWQRADRRGRPSPPSWRRVRPPSPLPIRLIAAARSCSSRPGGGAPPPPVRRMRTPGPWNPGSPWPSGPIPGTDVTRR
ncbi:NAD(P)/FAD-dependent oxidoreductase [Arthrobacter sp. RIT-PI-e]|uniref:NAD(P)/FAD-dependent oxidoreductase n=1 Tax=Arthrobacter sp. RIT-PI-e TaxID=1681197 RepID=UPI000A67106D